jgi:hypothetical protein
MSGLVRDDLGFRFELHVVIIGLPWQPAYSSRAGLIFSTNAL